MPLFERILKEFSVDKMNLIFNRTEKERGFVVRIDKPEIWYKLDRYSLIVDGTEWFSSRKLKDVIMFAMSIDKSIELYTKDKEGS